MGWQQALRKHGESQGGLNTIMVYVAGPFRATAYNKVRHNIRVAERYAAEIWTLGAACLCPHANTDLPVEYCDTVDDHDGAFSWLAGDLVMISRMRAGVDVLLLLPKWWKSAGAVLECRQALSMGLVVLAVEDEHGHCITDADDQDSFRLRLPSVLPELPKR